MELDNHPIPQDVSHFQFKLAGDMTLKQLGYLGAGFIAAWIIYAIPGNMFVKVPLIIMAASSGALLTFVPIAGRPADMMIRAYFKALFVPNQYMYHKSNDNLLLQHLTDHIIKNPIPELVLTQQAPPITASMPSQPQQKQEVVTIQQTYTPPPVPVQEKPKLPIVAPAPKQEEIKKFEENPAEEEKDIMQALEQAKQAEKASFGTTGYGSAHEKVMGLEKQLQEFEEQKNAMEKELIALRKKLAQKEQSQAVTPTTASQNPTEDRVKSVSQGTSKSVGAPIPDVPNIITGIIKDPRGNVLPNILIEVKDKDGNPVRAFKTNQLGQFASATPLLNGRYTITFEDSTNKHSFDTVEIVANGTIFMPIEITSIDQREELRKQLFG